MNGLSVCVSGAVPSEALLHHLLHAWGLWWQPQRVGPKCPKKAKIIRLTQSFELLCDDFVKATHLVGSRPR